MIDLNKLRDLDALKITLATNDEILSWSRGEVTKPETINYRTFKPEKDGLFCEKIFGPEKDYECACGKYKRVRYKGVVCDRCGVEVTTSKVRRERMGHISLASPVAHVWFFKNIPSVLAATLGLPPRSLELVIYFSSFIVIEIDHEAKRNLLKTFDLKVDAAKQEAISALKLQADSIISDAEAKIKSLSKTAESKWDAKLKEKAAEIRAKAIQKSQELLTTEQHVIERAVLEVKKIEKKLQEVELYSVMTDRENILLEEYLDEFCEVAIGAEAIQKILAKVDMPQLSQELHAELEEAKESSGRADKLRKRLKVIDSFIRGNVDPRSMIIMTLPVIPPEIRPMVQLEGGRFATSDLNDLYRRIINRNNRLRRLLDLGAPDIIVRNEKRMLQEAVDALFDSSKVRKTRTRDRKTYRSIADAIKGKQGHFRANLLGKRVDYSGRAVIVSGPNLKIHECGLPTEMAFELFRPFLIREIMLRGLAPNMKTAKFILEEKTPEVYSILEELVKTRPVLLNRAPTLHRLSVQAFFPKLTDSKAIQLHPVVCTGFNADFDGDQMAVHLPLSDEAVQEAIDIMLSTENLLKPADGTVITIPSHEMILGLYYLTSANESLKKFDSLFTDREEVMRAFGNKVIDLRQIIKLRLDNGQILETTPGRIIFNGYIPKEVDYINYALTKGKVKDLIKQTMEKAKMEDTVQLIDVMKTLGFKYSTISGVSLSVYDCIAPLDMEEVMKKAHEEVAQIEQNLHMGFVTKQEMINLSQKVWEGVLAHFDATIMSGMKVENPVNIVISAGAGKASPVQMRQIAAIMGLIADPQGKIIDMPILGNYTTGLSSFDYFLASRGVRKTYMDKGLGTADAGYLTRRLVNAVQDILIREEDCGANTGRTITRQEDTPLYPWYMRLVSRYALRDIKSGDHVIVKKNHLITKDVATEINAAEDINSVEVRSPMGCNTYHGICTKCYGKDLATDNLVRIGTAVGIMAAQSIGEPGVQLTMNSFHKGGIVSKNITEGLPRVEEIFEARKPKGLAVISAVTGKVRIEKEDGKTVILVEPLKNDTEIARYVLTATDELAVSEGQTILAGTKITQGAVNMQEMYEVVGAETVQKYIIDEIQSAYGAQGVSIHDKHLEVVVAQMFNRVKITKSGDTNLLPGDVVTRYKFDRENADVLEKGQAPAECKSLMLGISKASRMSESWLDAASFEETSGVLTESAVAGSIDKLIGLKENVIIGRRIPTGEAASLSLNRK